MVILKKTIRVGNDQHFPLSWSLSDFQANMKNTDLPSIEEELAQIFPSRSTPHRDYSREPYGRKVCSHAA